MDLYKIAKNGVVAVGCMILILLGGPARNQKTMAQPVRTTSRVNQQRLQRVQHVFFQIENTQRKRMFCGPFHDSADTNGQDWCPIDIRNRNPNSPHNLWLKFRLPPSRWNEPELFLQVPVRDFEVYQGRQLIYRSRDGIHEKKWQRSGLRIHFVHLESRPAIDWIFIRIHADRFSYQKVWGSFVIGERADYIREIVRHDFADMIITLICIFTGICFLISQTVNSKNFLPLVGLGQFIFCYGILKALELTGLQLIWDVPTLQYYGEALSFYYMPVGLIFFVGTLADPTISFPQMEPVYKRLMHAFTIHAFLMVGLDLAGVVRASITYPAYCVFLLGLIIFLGYKSYQISHQVHLNINFVIIGVVCMGLTAVHDILGVMQGVFLVGHYISNWGMLIFITCMALFMIKRFIYVNQELEDINKNLGARVQQRTAELAATHMELDEVNEELHSALQNLQESQLKLVQAAKMALLGNLVSGIAKEISAPLGAIRRNVNHEKRMIREVGTAEPGTLPATDQIGDYLWDAAQISAQNKNAVSRMIGLVHGLKNFARLDEAEQKVADLHEGIESTLLILNHQFQGRVAVIKDYGPVPPLLCFPQQLNQVFLHLLLNARQAMDEPGQRIKRITIQTRHIEGKIIIRIRDTGPGIAPEIIDRIFRPRFTTKPNCNGLGLSVCQEIIEKHHGKISVHSKLGEGAEFIIELPMQPHRESC